jgi:uncharacterized delta-60 repeat protein
VVAGRVGQQSNPGVGLARYNTNGTLDTTFSGDGMLTMEFASPGGGPALGVAIQTDGKIVIVGSTGADFAVARFNADGTLDTTFGAPSFAGIVPRNFGSASEGAVAVAILADGRIVVAGSTIFDGHSVFAFDYLSAGGAAETVGPGLGNGARHASFGGGSDAFAKGMAIQADGKVVLVGDILFACGIPSCVDRNMGIARFNTDGSMDPSFNGAGLRGIDFGSSSSARAVAIQADGKIVVVGNAQPFEGGFPNAKFAIARLNINGSLDPTFSGDGLLLTDFSATTADSGAAVALLRSDGRIVAAGTAGTRLSLARYHAFTCNGANVTILGTNGPDTITGTATADVIHGLQGDDIINGGDGDDIICGGGGTDILNGDLGNDTLLAAGLGTATLNGGDGGDTCVGSNLLVVSDPLDHFISCKTINTGGAGISGEWLAIEQHCNQSQDKPHCRLEGSLRVFNPGTEASAVASAVAFYLSADGVLDEDDAFLATEEVRALNAGADQIVKLKLKLPEGSDVAGFFVIAVVDFFDNVSERNEANNVAVSPAIVSRIAGHAR